MLLEVNVAVLEPLLPTEGEGSVDDVDLLEVNFFDDESVIMVFRLRSNPSKVSQAVACCSWLTKAEILRNSLYNDNWLPQSRVSRATTPGLRKSTHPRRFDAQGDGALEDKPCRLQVPSLCTEAVLMLSRLVAIDTSSG